MPAKKKLPVPGSETVKDVKKKNASKSAAKKQEAKEEIKEEHKIKKRNLIILPTIGRIKIGAKNEKGYPMRLDHFEITTDVQGAPEPLTLTHYKQSHYKIVKAIYGDGYPPKNLLKRIYGMLAFNRPEQNMFVYKGVYGRSGAKCMSEQITSLYTPTIGMKVYPRKTTADGEIIKEESTCSLECPMRSMCKWHGIFKMYPVIPKLENGMITFPTAYLGGVLIFRTTSYSIIKNMLSGMAAIKEAFGSLTGFVIQLDFTRQQMGGRIVNSIIISVPMERKMFPYKALQWEKNEVVREAEMEDETIDDDIEVDE